MRKFTVNLLTLSLGLALMPLAQAVNSPQQKQLLEQVRLGESTQREDLVRQSLYRLELIDPNNPDVIAARFRYLLRQGDTAGAQKELDRLKGIAPGSSAYQSSRNTMLLSTPDGRQQLQQARLLATTGHTQEAIAAYDKLFDGNPPGGDVATEYWNVVAKDPARRNAAINQLKKLTAAAPVIRSCRRRFPSSCSRAGAAMRALRSCGRWLNRPAAAARRLTCGMSRSKTSLPAAPASARCKNT